MRPLSPERPLSFSPPTYNLYLYGYDRGNFHRRPFPFRAGDWAGSARSVVDSNKNILLLLDSLRRTAQYERLSSLSRNARRLAGAQQKGRGVRNPCFHGAELPYQ